MKRKTVNILNVVSIMVDVGAGCGNCRYSPHNPFKKYNVKTSIGLSDKPFMYKRILENAVAL